MQALGCRTEDEQVEFGRREALEIAAMSQFESFQSTQTLLNTSFAAHFEEPQQGSSSQTVADEEDEKGERDNEIHLLSPPRPITSPPSPPPESDSGPRKTAPRPKFIFGKRARASRPEREHNPQPSTPPGRDSMSFDSDKAGSTQPYSQHIDEFLISTKSREERFREAQVRLAEANALDVGASDESVSAGDHTYITNETGHVQLLTESRSVGKQVSIAEEEVMDENEDEDELVEEEFDIAAQTAVIASQFPDDKRFKTPKTPASHDLRGRKRPRNGQESSTPGSAPGTTPRLPVNPFGGVTGANAAPMSLTQAFGATQAQSSPLPNAPNSDGISDRPSPHLGDVGHANTAPASSPTKLPETPALHSEPYTRYTPLSTSQAEREKKRTLSSPTAQPGSANAIYSEDDLDLDDSPVERKRQRQMPREKFERIKATIPSPASARSLGREKTFSGRTRARKDEMRPHSSPAGTATKQPSSSTMRSAAVLAEASNAHGIEGFINAAAANSTPQADAASGDETETDSEGVNRQVQVPRTISKKRQVKNVSTRTSSMHQQPESSLKRPRSAVAAIENSQPLESDGPPPPSKGSLSQVPDSTGVAQNSEKQLAISQSKRSALSRRSQQTATPPSSSPSPQRPEPTAANLQPELRTVSHLELPAVHEEPPIDILTSPVEPADPSNELPSTLPETGSQNAHSEAQIQPPSQSIPKPSPERKRTLRRPKKFGQILTRQSPLEPSVSFEFDISAFTADDQDFQHRLGHSPAKASPQRPLRRRNGPLVPAEQVPIANAVQVPSSPDASTPGNTDGNTFHTPRQVQDETPASQRDEPVSTTPEANHSEKENEPTPTPTPRRKRPAVDATPNFEAVAISSPQQQPASTISEPVVSPSRKRRRTGSFRELRRLELDQQSTGSGANATESPLRLSMPSLEHAPEPTMVWALFNGTQQRGYYPARCLGVAENNKLRVRFEDGNEALIPSAALRSLELRIGDLVKIDGKENKQHTFIVRELAEKQTCGPPATQIQSFSDIHGYTKVRLALKGDKTDMSDNDRKVSINMLYLTQTLFNALKGRTYTHPLDDNSTRVQTPSVSISTPGSPASKQRRVKTSMKKESILRQSYRASMHQQGLFSGMAFAVTALEQSKRLALQEAISNNSGNLLVDGFRVLFDIPGKELLQTSDGVESTSFVPNEQASTYGFTALLADKHCRTTTYLHALALNIPCISTCWIRDCINKDQLLDWRPYLLPSGDSQVLEGAVKSRVMELPPQHSSASSAIHWPLSSMLASRPQPMAGANVILISDSTVDKQMDAHLFIAYAMGASRVGWAQGWKKAEAYLRAGKHAWDWICGPDGSETTAASQKGRKRKSGVFEASSELEIRWKGDARVVRPEFVVQSLVLGRLVSE